MASLIGRSLMAAERPGRSVAILLGAIVAGEEDEGRFDQLSARVSWVLGRFEPVEHSPQGDVVFIDEAYTSKTSCISGDVTEIQKKAKSKSISTNEFKGTRVKRGLFKDSIIDKIWNADLNGAVNHIKVAFKDNFDWLRTALFKLCNPVVIKSANDFLMFLIGNSNAGKVQLSNAGQTF